MKFKIAALMLCLCLLVMNQPTFADIEFSKIDQITDDSGGDDNMPVICNYRDGLWLTWQSACQTITNGQDQDIVVSSFDGTGWSSVQELTSPSNTGADTTPVSIVHGGELYVAWATNDDTDSNGEDWDIVLRRHDGLGWAGIVEITGHNDTGDDYHPQLCSYGGKLYIAWQTWDPTTSDGADSDIVLKVLNNGTWEPVAKPMVGDEGNDNSHRLLVFEEMMYLIWSTDDKAGNGSDFDILARAFDGTQWNPVVQLTPTNDTGDDYHPYARVINQDLYVVWQTVDDATSVGKDDDIVMRVHDGQSWGAITEITSSTILGHKDTESDSYPIILDNNGVVAIIWQTNDPVTSSGNDQDMVMVMLDGDKWSKLIQISPEDDSGDDGGIYAHGADAAMMDGVMYIIWQTQDTVISTGGDWDLVMVEAIEGTGAGPEDDNNAQTVMILVILVVIIGTMAAILMDKKRK